MSALAEVRKLETVQDRCRTSAMAALTSALEQAIEGKIVAVAIAVVRPDGAANSSFSEADNVVTLIGAVELLKKRILAKLEVDD